MVEVNGRDAVPLYRQVQRAIVDGIRRGRLGAGAPLPGSRKLAQTLEVHRNTILAAYEALVAEGVLKTQPSGGTFVAPGALARLGSPKLQLSKTAGFDVPAPLASLEAPRHDPRRLILSRGAADPRLFPAKELARAYRTALNRHGRSLLFFGDPRGHEALREVLALMLQRTRGLPVAPDQLLVTRGSQMAVDLLARSLFQSGDLVAVEALGYPHVWSALRLAGAVPVPVPVDESGMSVVALEACLRKEKIKAVYVTPHHQFPTMRVMSTTHRMQLLDIAKRHRLAIIEDDYDYEFHYEGRPILPLASHDTDGVVIYIGTLSKSLAVGIRLGYIAASQQVISRLVSLRSSMDIQGDQVLETAIAELFEEGVIQRHTNRARRIYHQRRDALVESLQKHLPQLQFEVPAGGMALWVQVPESIRLDEWSASGLEHGVLFRNGSIYEFDGAPTPFMRLGFSLNDETENDEGVRRMALALAKMSPKKKSIG